MSKKWQVIYVNALISTCEGGYGLIPNGALAVTDGRITWIGNMDDLPDNPESLAEEVVDLEGSCMTPGLIDCHTHLVFGGNRANEFEMRLEGVSYEEIARQGGGIQSTVAATRALSEDELFEQSLPRARALCINGATTLEIKSGYGLDLATEVKMLRVAKRIGEELDVRVCRTFLGAHTVPKEFKEHPDKYVDYVCDVMLPQIAADELAEAVDVFCEKIAFNLAQTERIFQNAQELGLKIKCHAEQLSDSGAAALAAKYGALSVDHLEHISKEGVEAIAKAGTVAVLLPGAFYFLRETKLPPVNLLREYNVPIALASDCNPGTSPVTSLPLMMNMACTLFRLTPEEALLAVTQNAAKALGLENDIGTLTVGKRADIMVWSVRHPRELAYYF